MKNLKNNFGIRYVSTAKESFFKELEKPADPAWAKQAKKVFKGVENVKVEYVGF